MQMEIFGFVPPVNPATLPPKDLASYAPLITDCFNKGTLPDVAVLEAVLSGLDDGTVRVASPAADGTFQVCEWAKQAILLYLLHP